MLQLFIKDHTPRTNTREPQIVTDKQPRNKPANVVEMKKINRKTVSPQKNKKDCQNTSLLLPNVTWTLTVKREPYV